LERLGVVSSYPQQVAVFSHAFLDIDTTANIAISRFCIGDDIDSALDVPDHSFCPPFNSRASQYSPWSSSWRMLSNGDAGGAGWISVMVRFLQSLFS
jgi:hypothetical protein